MVTHGSFKWGKVRHMITLVSTRRFATRISSRRFAGAGLGTVLASAALLVLGCGPASDASEPLAPVTPNEVSMLGYNLDFPGDFTNLPPFIDQVKNSRAPQGSCSDEDPECDVTAHLDLDPRGWPRSLTYRDDPSVEYASIQLVISTSDERSDIGEKFVVTWEGDGDIDLINGGPVVERDDAERRLTFTLQPDVSQLRLSNIDPTGSGDYLRNVRVFRSDFESLLAAGEIFNPDMLDFLAPFRSIRFMDWMQSNAYGQCSGGSNPGGDCYAAVSPDCPGGGRCLMPGHWSERPTSDAPSNLASGQYLDPSRPELGTKVGGYSLETMVALANRVPADPHFNIPADYDEDYVRNFATYLRDHLAPGLTATIEYSNEVWNFGFPQAQYANQLGRALWPDEGSAWLQYMAGRTHTLCGIMKRVFTGQEGRVRCLMSPQTGWRDIAETVLDCPRWAAEHPGEGACDANVDAINITGYFAGCLINQDDRMLEWLGDGKQAALDKAFEQLEHGDVFDECSESEASLDHTIDNYRYFGELASSRGLGLYIYESGTHFNLPDVATPSVHDLLVAVTRDQRMHDLYTKNFQAFRDAGGSVMNVWGWVAPDDLWANADSLLDRLHPKYRAIRDFSSR
jgi:hypothetical protein